MRILKSAKAVTPHESNYLTEKISQLANSKDQLQSLHNECCHCSFSTVYMTMRSCLHIRALAAAQLILGLVPEYFHVDDPLLNLILQRVKG